MFVFQPHLLRRARIWDDLDWKFIEVGQSWRPGDVSAALLLLHVSTPLQLLPLVTSLVILVCAAMVLTPCCVFDSAQHVQLCNQQVLTRVRRACAAMCDHIAFIALQVTSPLELNLLVEKDYFKLLVRATGPTPEFRTRPA